MERAPDPALLKNLLESCEDCEYWKNFKKAAPIIFCMVAEIDPTLRQMRDKSFVEELAKARSILTLISEKLKNQANDVDFV